MSNSLNQAMQASWAQPKPKKRRTIGLNTPREGTPEGEEPVASSSTLAPKREAKKARTSKSSSSTIASKYAPPDLRLSTLGGLHKQISQLMEIVVLPILHPEIYEWTGVPRPRGVLLHGVPGGGKTQLVKCLAGELRLPFISISAPSIVSGMSGESEKTLRDTFDEAKKIAPCLLFLDEVDAITPKRETAQREMERRIVAQLLTCMDDLATSAEPVIIIGATNRPDSLDPALRRAGRFDHEIEMGVPTVEGREQILRVLCGSLRLSGNVDFHELAMATPGYVGADLTSLTGAAGVIAVKRIFQEIGEGRLVLPEDQLQVGAGAGAPEEELREGVEDMAVDGAEVEVSAQVPVPVRDVPVGDPSVPFSTLHPDLLNTPIAQFLISHPSPLTSSQLAPLLLIPADFTEALKIVQPSSKREGFTTVPDVTWANIGALKTIRDELHMAIVQPIRNPSFFAKVGIDAPSGVLLWGPPGCGKTLLAKAVANESHANFISVKGPELLNKYVGESEKAVRTVFDRARTSAPCVIFFDELDALVPRRDDSMSESSARVVNTLLTELDGLASRKSVYVIGATNRPDMIDPAMIRPGRLDKLLYVDLPSPAERYEILRTHTKRTPVDESSWPEIAEIVKSSLCDGFSGADLAALVREAATLALRSALEAAGAFETDPVDDAVAAKPDVEERPPICVSVEHFRLAADKTKPSVSREQKNKYERMRDKYAGLPARGKRWKAEDGEAEKPSEKPANAPLAL